MIKHTDLPDDKTGQKELHRLIRRKIIALGGNNKLKIYGLLNCTSGKRMLRKNRVFFHSEEEAIAYGFRPCGHCLRDKYLQWKNKVNKMQSFLFKQEPLNLLSSHGEAIFYPVFFTAEESNRYFPDLLNEIKWKQEPIKIFGKEVMQPRLTAWYGDTDKAYSYSGITMQPNTWTETLKAIKQKIEPVAGVKFTNALLNLYRDGNDSMGWHRDNEKELGNQPIIGSVSFGETRTFQFRNYKTKKDLISLELNNGSFLLMRGDTNHYWEHSIPKTKQAKKERINITFRVIY